MVVNSLNHIVIKALTVLSLFFTLTLVGRDALAEYKGETFVGADIPEINQLILSWGVYRDNGHWEQLSDTFHPNGEIQVTWYSGSFSGFVAASQEMANKGMSSVHVHYPSILKVGVGKAFAITPVNIKARAKLPLGVEVDIVSDAFFYDFLEKRSGKWAVNRRVCVYDKDRMDSTSPSIRFWLMSLFSGTKDFHPAYQYLAWALSKKGYEIQDGIVIYQTPEAEALYHQGVNWVNGTQ